MRGNPLRPSNSFSILLIGKRMTKILTTAREETKIGHLYRCRNARGYPLSVTIFSELYETRHLQSKIDTRHKLAL